MAGTLDIVIVNWNAGERLGESLRSITPALAGVARAVRVVVVDNASSDRSLDAALSGAGDMPDRVDVIRNAENRGFAAACNQGAAGSAADHLLFLNPDATLFDDSLSVPMAFMDNVENAAVGICGVQLVDARGNVSRSCARFPSARAIVGRATGLDRILPAVFRPHFMREWDHCRTRDVDQVMGAFFWIRRGVFEALGGFDERFFVYFEEVDLSLRARRAGWKTRYLSGAKVLHHGWGTTEMIPETRLFYSLRSRLLFVEKHFSAVDRAVARATTLVVEPCVRAVGSIFRMDGAGARAAIGATRRLWQWDRGHTGA